MPPAAPRRVIDHEYCHEEGANVCRAGCNKLVQQAAIALCMLCRLDNLVDNQDKYQDRDKDRHLALLCQHGARSRHRWHADGSRWRG